MAFVGSGDGAIEILDTFNPTFPTGRIFIKDIPSGPLRAVLPFPGDNVGLTCATKTVDDQFMNHHRLGCGNLRRWEFRHPPPGEHPDNYGGCLCRGEADRYHGRGRCGCDRRSKERRAQPPSVEALTPA